MKKFIRQLWCVFLLMATTAIGQGSYTETEPNNSFGAAGNMRNYDTLKASVGGPDAIDFFKPDIAFWSQYGYGAGTLVVTITATNTGAAQARMWMDLYNGLQAAGLVHTDSTALIPAGGTRSATFRFCGQYMDDFYTAFRSNGTVTYELVWFFSDPNPNAEPNNTRGAAANYAFDSLNAFRQAINYQYRQNPATDTVDWFRTVLPAEDYSNIGLEIEAKNNSCLSSRSIQYAIYKNNETAPVLTGYVGGSSVGQFQTVNATIPLGAFHTGDHLYIRIWSTAAFGYSFQFRPGVRTLLHEPNDDAGNATPLVENTVLSSTIGEVYDNNGNADEEDYLRIITPKAGTLKVYVEAVNRACPTDYNNIDFYVYDKNLLLGASAARRYYLGFVNWEEANCTSTLTETFTLNAVAADTFYLAVFGYVAAGYKIRWEVVADGFTPDPEPNNTEATAIPLTAKEVKKGTVGYKQASPFDGEDIYKITLPKAGNVRVFVKGIYKDPTITNSTSNRLRVVFSNATTIRYVPGTNPPAQIVQNTAYADTIRLCGLAAGVLYARIQSGNTTTLRPYDYEISYELEPEVDTTNDREPDNDYATATPVRTGKKVEGLIGRTINSVMDMNDYHRIFVTGPDSLRITFGGTNIGCVDNRYLRLYGYNGRRQLIFVSGFILNAVGTVDAGQTVERSLTEFIPGRDTIFIRMNADGLFNYHFTTNQQVPSPVFRIAGDTTACAGPQYVYKAEGVLDENLTYHWSLPLGGGTLMANGATATVTWTESAPKKIALYLSNAKGASVTKELNVIVNGTLPTAVPVAFHFARRLRTSNVPPGAVSQWYRNGAAINGATDSTYYAADAGEFSVRFVNDCGSGPTSNTITFDKAAQPQVITFANIGTLSMAQNLRLALTATSSSGLPVLYQLVSGKGSVVNDSLRITGTGPIVLRAYQPGDDVYSPAADVVQTITVVKGAQVITFDSLPDRIFLAGGNFPLLATSSSGRSVGFRIVSGEGRIVGSQFRFTGAGTVTISAELGGNNDYNAATPVVRTFCIGVRSITPIKGDAAPCPATYTYTTQKIPGATYHWTLTGGGVLNAKNDTAFVQWQTPGSHTLRVKANTACDGEFTNEESLDITLSNSAPAPVSGMQPAEGSRNQQLPLTLSWIPGRQTTLYDLFVWDSASARPAQPYKTNLNDVSFVLPLKSFPYNTTYKWQVIAKNPCAQTAGPVQHFRLIPLADLVVSQVSAPATANSGQTITISWKVTNIGPGRTLTTEKWKDGVFFSFDTVPNFRSSPNWNPASWNSLTANGRPLLVGTRQNPSALDSGQSYAASINFTLPVNYSQPLYVYVITDYPHAGTAPLQVTVQNDTLRAERPVAVTISPTPDLRIDTVTAPTSAFSGSTVNLTYQLKNYGVNTPPKPAWRDSVFFSQSPFFVRELAIPVNYPKADGSYYPNANRAAPQDTLQLLANATRTRSLPVVIPNYIFGTWFIYVKTNADDKLYEGAANGNNVNRAQIEVYLTPTPKLTINSLTIPANNVSTTQPFGLNWIIFNDGFRDNIEKNRGHYLTYTTCQPGGGFGGSSGRMIAGRTARNVIVREQAPVPAIKTDSVVFGSSYWLDRVYLSKDPSGLNLANAVMVAEVKHGRENSGIYPDLIYCPANVSGNVNVDNIINPGSNFPKSATFNIPSNLEPGTYYAYVVTNATKTVYEYPGTLQVRRSEAISIQRPDLSVPSVVVPATVSGGQRFSIHYTVQNNGQGSVFNHRRRDRIYTSIWPVFDQNAVLIDTVSYVENIPAGSSVAHSREYAFPHPTSGARYVYVQTNDDSLFRETTMANNTSAAAPLAVSAGVATDLVVTSVNPVDSFFTIFGSSFRYTVTNNGTGTTAGTWTDSLFISCSPAFNPATAKFIGLRRQQRSIATGESYTDTLHLKLPYSYELSSCFPETKYGTAYFFVKTNADSATYEGSAVNNNVGGSGSRVLVNPLVDHQVNDVAMKGIASVGRPFTAAYTVKNIGYNPNIYAQYQSFWDAIYLSPDSVLNNNDVRLNHSVIYRTINRNDTLRVNRGVTVPDVPAGDYYLLVHTNYANTIKAEKNQRNNVNLLRDADGKALKFRVERPSLPDLVDSIITAPDAVALGQPFTVVRRVTNRGQGATFPTNWASELKLSVDFTVTPNDGDRLLEYKKMAKVLQPGQSMLDTVTATIPIQTEPGNYVLISHPNASGAIVESNSINNLGLRLLTIYEPPATDLTVMQVTAPDTVLLGYTIDSVKWVVRNQSAADAVGVTRDGLYLSASGTFDSTALLIGIKEKKIDLDPLEGDALAAAPLVTGVVEGLYNLFVKTDLQNNIVETDKDNNTGGVSTPIYVKVKELPFNVPEGNTLGRIGRYYKLLIPDSLIGATIRVVLKTADSFSVRNEVFIGGGYVPSPARFDYKFENPNAGNQQVVMASVTEPVYYIYVQSATQTVAPQAITLRADVLPFAILNVQSPSGGNSGNVTVKLSGSLFTQGMTAHLKNGGVIIDASQVYFANSTLAYATFNLRGRSLGVYDVLLKKGDTATALMEKGFSVVPTNNGGLLTGSGPNTGGSGSGNEPGCDPGAPSGLNSQLVVELMVPPRVLLNRPVVIQLNYHNPTNVDIPAQSRVLFIEDGLKLALRPEDVPNGTDAMHLELTEQGGPPGIIRAGGSGTITLYTRAPARMPLDPQVFLKLK